MRKNASKLKVAAGVLAALAVSVTGAQALPKKVKDMCGLDYQDFCSQYHPDSAAARSCFESNRRSLTKDCVRALIDAGMVPARYLRK